MTQAQKPARRSAETQEQQEAAKTESVQTDDVAALLDEVDKVLEVDAEEFVLNYKQKGGE